MAVRPPPVYEKSVFINCPFDREYQELLLAVVFTVTAHRLLPRSARETEGEPARCLSLIQGFSRILGRTAESKYSIHDLSRSTGEGGDTLASFNMPLELGMAAAFRFEREGTSRTHKWLVLVPEGYAYQTFISDMAGFDPARHDSSAPSIIREVSAWLSTREDVLDPVPSALRIFERFPYFRDQLSDLRAAALDKQTWTDVLLAASKTVPIA
jgi:hypothetical protein